MIIHRPVVTETDKEVHLAARIEIQSGRRGIPEDLWFRFQKNYKNLLSHDIDPFVVSLLLLAMQNGEAIEV